MTTTTRVTIYDQFGIDTAFKQMQGNGERPITVRQLAEHVAGGGGLEAEIQSFGDGNELTPEVKPLEVDGKYIVTGAGLSIGPTGQIAVYREVDWLSMGLESTNYLSGWVRSENPPRGEIAATFRKEDIARINQRWKKIGFPDCVDNQVWKPLVNDRETLEALGRTVIAKASGEMMGVLLPMGEGDGRGYLTRPVTITAVTNGFRFTAGTPINRVEPTIGVPVTQ